MSRRRALILLSAAALFWLCRHAYYVGFFNDDAYYLFGAKSLLSGRFAQIHSPGAPPLTDYLPGWPLMLAPALLATGGSIAAAQLWALLLLVAGLGLFAAVFERESGPEQADLTLACAVVSPLLASTAATLLSDGPMLFCAGASLALLPRVWARRDLSAWLGFGLLLGAAALVRPTGLALPLAVAAVLALGGRRREPAVLLSAAAAVFAAWLTRDAVLSGTSWNQWREASAAARAGGIPLLSNAWACVDSLFGRALLRPPLASRILEAFTVVAGSCLALAGARGMKTPGGKAAVLYAACFIAPHLLWAKTADRYFIPLVPLAAWLAVRGAGAFSARVARAVAAASIILSLAASARVVRASWSPATRLNIPPLASSQWLRRNASPGSVLAAEYDARWSLLTGLESVHIPYDARTPAALSDFLEGAGASFVVVEDTSFALRPAGGAYAVPEAGELRALLQGMKKARLVLSDSAGLAEVWAVSGSSR